MMTIFMFALLVCGVFGDEVKSVSVMEGDSVTLHTDITEIQKDDDIKWLYSDLLVHIVGSKSEIKNIEGFKDRLQIDIQSGDLIIKNMKKKHAGLYKAVIDADKGTFERTFNVIVNDAPCVLDAGTDEVKSVSETEGKSVTLYNDVNLQRDALILWRFGNQSALIAKVNMEDNRTPEYPNVLNGSFKGRLQVNDQTGNLIISNVRYEDAGVYKLKISSNNKETLYKTFTVSIRGGGLSEDCIVLICILVIVALVAALVAWWYWRRSSQLKVREIFVEEGESVTLSTADIKGFIFRDGVFEWKYGDQGIIAEINTNDNTKTTPDERYQSRLELNNETGDLTINNLKTKHSGLYKVKFTSSRGWPFSLLGASYCQFNVIVTERIVQVKYGGPVTLHTDVKGLQAGDEILWMTGAEDTRIAKFTVGTEDPVLYPYTDDRYNDRLQINPQTGDLTIKDITPEHCEVYKVMICSNQRSTSRRFRVSILVQAEKGKSVRLETEGQIQSGDRVEWSFRDDPLKRTSYDKITLVTGMNRDINKTKYPNKRFKGRLEMNAQTGDLTITKIRQTDGVYTLQQHSTGGKITNWVFSVVFVKFMSVAERDPLTLPVGDSALQTGAQIVWKFNNRLIMTGVKTDKGINVTHSDDQQFKDRLNLNPNVGSLIIKNISKVDTGLYEVKITNNKQTSHTIFQVDLTVKEEVYKGIRANLPFSSPILSPGTEIEWKFKGRVIMTGVITADPGNTGTKREDLKLSGFTGQLIIEKVSEEHTGLYERKLTYKNETFHSSFDVKVIGESTEEDLNEQTGARTNRDEPEPTAGDPLLNV